MAVNTLERIKVATCDMCGWWSARQVGYDAQTGNWSASSAMDEVTDFDVYGACGTLTKFASEELSRLAMQDVEQFVIARGSALDLLPRVTEELVVRAYRNVGYDAIHVGKTGDGGIDILLFNKRASIVGVQVKRYKNKVGVSEIREFVGALVFEGIAHGIFVSTSRYTRGAMDYVGRLPFNAAIRVDLVNGDALLELLRISRLRAGSRVDLQAAIQDIAVNDLEMKLILSGRRDWGWTSVEVLNEGGLVHAKLKGEVKDPWGGCGGYEKFGIEEDSSQDAAPIVHKHIQARAYEIYLDRKDGNGDALSDWLMAEREYAESNPDSDLPHKSN